MKKVYIFIFVLVILFIALFLYKKEETKILFVGDMMFDRYIRKVGYEKGGDFIFSCANLSGFLKGFSLVVGNLEGPITENASRSMFTEPGSDNNFVFTFPTNTAGLLAEKNIKLVNLGNNHMGNFGQEGISSTKKYLDKAGVNYFDSEKIYHTEFANVKISFISYNEFSLLAGGTGGDSAQKVAQKVFDEKAKKQTVIVYAHWGDEYSEVPTRIKETATLFAKNGADFIIGSHPHIILPSEKIPSTSSGQKETTVYYSLGNFIFDQYWNKEVSTGLVLELDVKGDDLKIIEHKVSLNRDGRTCLVN